MAEKRPEKRKMHTYTVAALLGIFVGAAALAIVSRLLPGRLSQVMRPPGVRNASHDSSEESGS